MPNTIQLFGLEEDATGLAAQSGGALAAARERFDAAFASAQETGQPVRIMFFSPDCGHCDDTYQLLAASTNAPILALNIDLITAQHLKSDGKVDWSAVDADLLEAYGLNMNNVVTLQGAENMSFPYMAHFEQRGGQYVQVGASAGGVTEQNAAQFSQLSGMAVNTDVARAAEDLGSALGSCSVATDIVSYNNTPALDEPMDVPSCSR